MQLFPAIEDFTAGFAAGRNQVVWTRLVADLDTPVSLMLKLTEARKDSFLLESVTGGEVRGRYSIMGMKPDLVWECRGTAARINRSARFDPDGLDGRAAPARSRACARSSPRAASSCPPELPPMAAGLFGYLGYDMVRLVEHLPHVNPDPLGLPDAVMLRPSVVLVVDGVKGEVTVVSPAWANSGLSPRAAYAQAAERVMDAVRDLDRTPAQASRDLGDLDARRAGLQHQARALPRDGRAGEGVHPRRRHLPGRALAALGAAVRPAALRALPRAPAHQPLALHVLLQLRRLPGGRRQPRDPRPPEGRYRHHPPDRRHPPARRRPPVEDLALEAELLADPKERAEHLMLLDLGRNDVGRVARIGTVDPNEQFIIERYSHVMHIVSNVDGALADGQDALSALLAGLPAGTVSGAPKVRAMQIIDELEAEKRGVYGGGVGYFARRRATWTSASRSAPRW